MVNETVWGGSCRPRSCVPFCPLGAPGIERSGRKPRDAGGHEVDAGVAGFDRAAGFCEKAKNVPQRMTSTKSSTPKTSA